MYYLSKHIIGVDKVISVDLQRPGQGHEACFFDTQIPVETIMAEKVFVKYFAQDLKVPLQVSCMLNVHTNIYDYK